MKTWVDFKIKAKKISPIIKKDIEEIEKMSFIIYSKKRDRNKKV